MGEDRGRRTTLVLMSVYNGEQYLVQQLESILCQVPDTPDVYVRDDGSTDSTPNILRAFVDRFPKRVSFVSGPNLGAAESFMEVLFSAPLDHDYFALSDADDVWLPDKLAKQVQFLRAMVVPHGCGGAVVSRMEIVDARLAHLGYSQEPPRGFSFRNALVETVFNGAASMIDRAAMDLVRTERPSTVTMHDSWLYLVLSARGVIGFSPQVALQYRQHGTNVFGVRPSRRARLGRRLSRLRGPNWKREEMLLEFRRIHGSELDAVSAAELSRFLERHTKIGSGVRYAIQPGRYMQRSLADIYHRFLVALGRD